MKLIGPAVALALLILTVPASAQQELLPPPPDAENNVSRLRLGPFWLNPTIALTNAGIDTNVFNEPDSLNPKSDFTFTLTPQTDVWLRMGRSWLGGVVKDDLLWYQTYDSERASNESYTLGWLAPLTRVSFAAEANLLDTRDRVGFEIDARLQHTDLTYHGTRSCVRCRRPTSASGSAAARSTTPAMPPTTARAFANNSIAPRRPSISRCDTS